MLEMHKGELGYAGEIIWTIMDKDAVEDWGGTYYKIENYRCRKSCSWCFF